jgi:AraC family transcriptional regulator
VRFRRVVAHIRDHLVDNLSFRVLAGIAGLPPQQFVRLFKKDTGMVPSRFVLHQRIARAAALLANMHLTISEIGLAVGIANESHFKRHFRRVTGKTPEQFRVDIANPYSSSIFILCS